MLANQEHTTYKVASKKGSFVAALVIVAIVAAVSLIKRDNGISEEISDGTSDFRAEGYAGYKYFSEEKTWDSAQEWCVNHGMVLATIDEQWKLEEVIKVAGNKQSLWIGLRAHCDSSSKSCYAWESGAAKGWVPWAEQQPSDISNQQCTQLNSEGKVKNEACDDNSKTLPFVCDKAPYIQGYAMHGVNGAGFTFDQADEQCRIKYGTTLATLNKNPEVMHSIISQTPATAAWIGLRVTPGEEWSESNFQFISGEPRTEKNQLKWALGEPNLHHERCAEIQGSAKQGELNDLPCDTRVKWYLCDQFAGNNVHRYSGFEINGLIKPKRNWQMPKKMINWDGRIRYTWKFDIRIDALTQVRSSIMKIGNDRYENNPSVELNAHSQRRLSFQQSRNAPYYRAGCSPIEDSTPNLGQWFSVELSASMEKYEIKYNQNVVYTRQMTVKGSDHFLKVWIGSLWDPPAPVTLRQVRFVIY